MTRDRLEAIRQRIKQGQDTPPILADWLLGMVDKQAEYIRSLETERAQLKVRYNGLRRRIQKMNHARAPLMKP